MKYIIVFSAGILVGVAALLAAVWIDEERMYRESEKERDEELYDEYK